MVATDRFLKAAAAAVLGLAYLDAKHLIGHDLHSIKSVIQGKKTLAKYESDGVLNFFYRLEEHARAQPDKVHLVYRGREWTYRQSYDVVLRYANYFSSLDIRPGDLVAVDSTNKPAMVFTILGLWAIGASPALINFNLQDAALLHCITVSEAKVLVYDREVHRNVATIDANLKELGIRAVCHDDPEWPDEMPGDVEMLTEAVLSRQSTSRPADRLRAGVDPTSTCALIYTSGSTGMPKAAVIPWSKFTFSSATTASVVSIEREDRFYSCMPIYHGTACLLGFGLTLGKGATFIIGHKFSNKTFWSEVCESRATVIQYVGEVCRYLMAAPPSPLERQHNVRTAFGNGMRPDVWQKFRARFGIPVIAEFFASTEGVGASFNYNTSGFGAGAVGRSGSLVRSPLFSTYAIIRVDPDTEVELRTPAGTCELASSGEPGEICFLIDGTKTDKTKVFTGYYGNAKASNSKLIRDVKKKGDLYVRMGDVISQDRDGFLYFHDRMGDTFRWKGENVSTTEVSEAIGDFPGLLECNVYGVQLPNHDGRVGCAAVLLDADKALDLDALARHLARALPKYAVPQFLRVVEKMEVTGNHKHQKVGLRKQGVDPAQTKQDVMYWLKDGKYVRFSEPEWALIVGGGARL